MDSRIVAALSDALAPAPGAAPSVVPTNEAARRAQARDVLERLEKSGFQVIAADPAATQARQAFAMIRMGINDLFSGEDQRLKYASLFVLFVVLLVLYLQPLAVLFGLLAIGVAFFIMSLTRKQ
ncbi:hypothetical protein CFR73_07035 [Novacetimonas maltaceti]|uniref:Uncharacterized protein n=1 Tax=Novacetimonas maltaceti TaxID=1203393 RepID=A0A2S3VZP5_9PROT|nr:hypothetical protein [Novacetimonas maltaceti]POF62048.1 hypothetical protein KMAL_23290 [Novacetimonas maltaceti]PYD60414.1 hypothetical protein CFR73_07035 [Novacetimonas maltaceti]